MECSSLLLHQTFMFLSSSFLYLFLSQKIPQEHPCRGMQSAAVQSLSASFDSLGGAPFGRRRTWRQGGSAGRAGRSPGECQRQFGGSEAGEPWGPLDGEGSIFPFSKPSFFLGTCDPVELTHSQMMKMWSQDEKEKRKSDVVYFMFSCSPKIQLTKSVLLQKLSKTLSPAFVVGGF